MTADQNAALVRRGYEAFNVGDLATLTELLSEDVTFYQPGASPVSGDHRGRDEVLAYFGELQARSGGTFRVEVENLYASDRQPQRCGAGHAHRARLRAGRRQGDRLRRGPGGPGRLGRVLRRLGESRQVRGPDPRTCPV